MARIYLDEDVSENVERALSVFGHAIRHARKEPEMLSATDSAQLLAAYRFASIFVTHNRSDFRVLHDAWRRWTITWKLDRHHRGILIIPQRVSFDVTARAVHEIIAGGPTLQDEMYEWTVTGGWRHHPYRP